MIKKVPSKVFNEGLDKWIRRSYGQVSENMTHCSYCDNIGYVNTSPNCDECPLTDMERDIENTTDGICCNGLWQEYRVASDYGENPQLKKAMKIADKIADFIIDRCVYEVAK